MKNYQIIIKLNGEMIPYDKEAESADDALDQLIEEEPTAEVLQLRVSGFYMDENGKCWLE
jgi:hypothetical protein